MFGIGGTIHSVEQNSKALMLVASEQPAAN